MNLSSGLRPVCLPVRTTIGPSAAMIPSPARMASSNNSAVERFVRTRRPSVGAVAVVGVVRVAVTIIAPWWSGAGRVDPLPMAWHIGSIDRPRVPRAVPRGPAEGVGFRSRADCTPLRHGLQQGCDAVAAVSAICLG